MCRMFGFRSVINSQVHSSLTSAENALMVQSENHPDGWGVAYYLADVPHIVKSVQTAINDTLFKRVSGIVSSQTVVAHLRKATTGQLSNINTHPFQFGRWVFAHNGNIQGFDKNREALVAGVDIDLRRYILGTTDSEVIFYLLLTHIRKRHELHSDEIPMTLINDAIQECLQFIQQIAGTYCREDDGAPTETFLSFILTNGHMMIAHQGGKRMFYSTHKTKCGDSGSCPFYAPECEAPSETGLVNHLILSSEPIQGENIWIPMKPGQTIGVDGQMRIYHADEIS